MEPVTIPDSHRDLLEGPINATLVTVMPNGQPHATVVWCGLDGPDVILSTMQGFQKERNMRTRPQVSLVVVDPNNSKRWIEVRGTVELVESGALADLDALTVLYTGLPHYFGDVVPPELAERETPVTCRITPTRVKAEDF